MLGTQHRGVLAEGDGVESALGILVDHLGAQLGIQQPWQLAGDDPFGVRACPDIQVPVVPSANRGQRQLSIAGHQLQPLAGEPGQEGREVQRRVDAVQIHVSDALVNIPSAPAHFVETDRFEAVLGDGSPDHGVETDVGQFLIVVDPCLSTVVGVDDVRCPVGELAREAAGKGVWGFDDVVVQPRSRCSVAAPGVGRAER